MINNDTLKEITYLAGNEDTILGMPDVPALQPFSDMMIKFLGDVSKKIMSDKGNFLYHDVVTFAFWIRAASLNRMKKKHSSEIFRLGRGVAFHIAPSNVPVNFAYSLVSGLLTGNANIVRVPSKEFKQVDIIANAFKSTLNEHMEIRPYIALIKYDHSKAVNDVLSGMANVRIIWGGDATIASLRESPLPPRSTEILFADRFSLSVIDADIYMDIVNKSAVADGFYNDTYLTDQNACTSPRIVVWHGERKDEAKNEFWKYLHTIVKKKYSLQDMQAVNKLASSYLAAVGLGDLQIIPTGDNLITRIYLEKMDAQIPNLIDNSGFFFEYDCDDPIELWDVCNNVKCQTVGVIGDKMWIMPLIEKGIKGIDRVVDVGHTMDFELIWDGYDLCNALTRNVVVS